MYIVLSYYLAYSVVDKFTLFFSSFQFLGNFILLYGNSITLI